MLMTASHLTRRSFITRSGGLLTGLLIDPSALADSLNQTGSMTPLGKIIDEFYAAYEELNIERLIDFLKDDCFFEDPTFHLIAHGKSEIRKMFADSVPHFSNVRIPLENKIVCRDWVITQQRISGIFKPNSDTPGEGRKISVRGATIFGFKNGKINRWIDYYDFATFQKQTKHP